jgi:RNA-binding protein
MQTLSSKEIRELREKLHHLKPVVIIGGNGLTDNVLFEIDRALNDHELIKIRIDEDDREKIEKMATLICEKNNSELVQIIGHIVAIYRALPSEE